MTLRGATKARSGPMSKRPRLIRTNIVIDRALVDAVKERTGARTAREAVQRALEQAAARFTLADLQAMIDLDAIRPGYDPEDPTAEDRYVQSAVAEPAADYRSGRVEPSKKRKLDDRR